MLRVGSSTYSMRWPPLRMYRKTCPVCSKEFEHEKERVRCCSLSCARVLQVREYGPNSWKGGRTRHIHGYIKQHAPNHPHADCGGYVMQHRLVMEKELGRFLHPRERVHHKNGQRDDNRPENLELWTLGRKDPAGVRVEDLMREMIHQHPELAEKILRERDPDA